MSLLDPAGADCHLDPHAPLAASVHEADRLRRKTPYETGMFSRVRPHDGGLEGAGRSGGSTFMERLLSLGTISIETAGETGRLTMAGIEDPQEVADYILEAARK